MSADLSKTPVEAFIDEVTAARSRKLQADIRPQNKQPYLYLSGIHTCARNLYYRMTDGDKRQPFDEFTQAKLNAGNDQEKLVKGRLLDMGYELIKSQERIEIPYQGPVTELRGQIMGVGKIDGAVVYQGVELPAEVKAMHPNVWARVNTVDDLLSMQYTERYVRQLILYLYGKEKDMGLFILTDFMGHDKLIPVFLGNHLDVAEFALRAMEKAWEYKSRGEAPERISFHSKICGQCDFAGICLPSVVVGGEAEVIEDPELEATLARHEELKAIAAEYKDLHDEVRDRFKNSPQTTVGGRFVVIPKIKPRVSYDTDLLDDETKAKIRKTSESVTLEIQDLTGGNKP